MATTWAVYTNKRESSEVYAHTLWELEAQHVPHPEKSGEYCDVYKVTLIDEDIPDYVSAYIALTERKFDDDRCVEFWQDYSN